jgi:hypothetical protein
VNATSELYALLGVVLGAGLSWAAGALTDRARFRRDQMVYWQQQRLGAYVDFAVASKRTMAILYRVGASLGVDDQTEPISLDEARPLLAEAFHERDSAFERVLLVGSNEVTAAARSWVPRIWTMRQLASSREIDSETWTAAVNDAREQRNAFDAVAKVDLAVATQL